MLKVNHSFVWFERFENGEILVDTKSINLIEEADQLVEFKWQENTDLIKLCFVLSHIKDKGLRIKLLIYYMPYSRMDRYENNNCFTLKHVTKLINSCLDPRDRVYVFEPHSEVTIDFLNNAEKIDVITPLTNTILQEHKDINVICYPDKGARNRFNNSSIKLPIIYCDKSRDFDTREITGLDLWQPSSLNLSGKNVLIIDDLCGRGTTFYNTANKLKEVGVNNIYLACCHMEAIGLASILMPKNKDFNIKGIFCFNTMLKDEQTSAFRSHNNVTIYNCEELQWE